MSKGSRQERRGFARYDELQRLKKALSDLLDDLEMRAAFEFDGCVPCGNGVYSRAREICPGPSSAEGRKP